MGRARRRYIPGGAAAGGVCVRFLRWCFDAGETLPAPNSRVESITRNDATGNIDHTHRSAFLFCSTSDHLRIALALYPKDDLYYLSALRVGCHLVCSNREPRAEFSGHTRPPCACFNQRNTKLSHAAAMLQPSSKFIFFYKSLCLNGQTENQSEQAFAVIRKS